MWALEFIKKNMDRIRSRLPQLEFCCCGCSLRAGSLVIGWASLIGYAIFASFLATIFVHIMSGKPIPPEFNNGSAPLSKLDVGGHLFLSTLFVITSFILLVGLHKSKAKLLVPFLIFLSIGVIIDTVTFAVSAFMMIVEIVRGIPVTINIGEKLISMFDSCLSAYFILVIHSHYNILKQSTSYVRENI